MLNGLDEIPEFAQAMCAIHYTYSSVVVLFSL